MTTAPYGYVRADGKGIFIYGDHQFTNNQDHDLIPVYTHPKEWVGLTDEEVRQMCGSVPSMKEAVREAEVKLKEKNSA